MESPLNSPEMEHKLSEQYKFSCEICGCYPELKYLKQFSKGELLIDLSSINAAELEVLCHAVTQSFTPHIIEITRSGVRNHSGTTAEEKKHLIKILKALGIALRISRNLSVLKLENVFLSSSILSSVCQGLAKTTHLQVLHFKNCPLNTPSLIEICSAIKNISCISTLALNNCRLDSDDVRIIKNLITHQGLNRTSALWKNTLRAQLPNLDKMRGLRHLLLSNNPHIGDEGVQDLLFALSDDIWITGMELQNCGITSKSMEAICDLLKVNQVIELLSLENNPFLDSEFVEGVNTHLRTRNPNYVPKQTETRTKQSILKDTQKAKITLASKIKNTKRGVPWRIEGRLIERKEGLPIGTLSLIFKEIRKSTPKCSGNEDEGDLDVEISLHQIRRIICYYKAKLKNETRRRLSAERRVQRLERRIKRYEETIESSYILDESTFFYVERCFVKFQSLIEKFRETGYQWQNAVLDKTQNEDHEAKTTTTSFQPKSKTKSTQYYISQSCDQSPSSQSALLHSALSSQQVSSQRSADSSNQYTSDSNTDLSLFKQLKAVKDRLIQISEKSLKGGTKGTEIVKKKSTSREKVDVSSSLEKVSLKDATTKVRKTKVVHKTISKKEETELSDQRREIEKRTNNSELRDKLCEDAARRVSLRKKSESSSKKSSSSRGEKSSKRSEIKLKKHSISGRPKTDHESAESWQELSVSSDKVFSGVPKNTTDDELAVRKSASESYSEIKSNESRSHSEEPPSKEISYSEFDDDDGGEESYLKLKYQVQTEDQSYSDFEDDEQENSPKQSAQIKDHHSIGSEESAASEINKIEISLGERESTMEDMKEELVDQTPEEDSEGFVVSEELVESEREENDDTIGSAPIIHENFVQKDSLLSDIRKNLLSPLEIKKDFRSSGLRKSSQPFGMEGSSSTEPRSDPRRGLNKDAIDRSSSSKSTNVTNSSDSASAFNMKNVHFFPMHSDADPPSPATDDEKLSRRQLRNITDRKPSAEFSSKEKIFIDSPAPLLDQRDRMKLLNDLPDLGRNVSLSDKSISEREIHYNPNFSFPSSRQHSLSSVSQQLSKGHENWTKGGRNAQPEESSQKQESPTEDFESDFEESDEEEISFSASSTPSESKKSDSNDF